MLKYWKWMLVLSTLVLAGVVTSVLSAGEASLGDLHAYTIKKSGSFSDLETWIAENYTEHLDIETVDQFTAGDFSGIAFRTLSDGVADSYLAIDNGDEILLLSTSRLSTTDPDLTEDEALARQRRLGLEIATKATDTCDTPTNRCNCVFYARCRVPKLPYGMTTYSEKVSKINSSIPTVGSVAIMNIYPPYGHVAVVTAVNRNAAGNITTISVREANYQACKVSNRTATPASMKVVGYFRP